MRDEIDARAWAEHHRHFGTAVARFVADMRVVFERLAAIRYDAPWQRRNGTDCR